MCLVLNLRLAGIRGLDFLACNLNGDPPVAALPDSPDFHALFAIHSPLWLIGSSSLSSGVSAVLVCMAH
jgi:hypothetical protein